MAGGGGPGKDHELGMQALRADYDPRRWTRAVWFRFALALVPLALVAVIALIIGR